MKKIFVIALSFILVLTGCGASANQVEDASVEESVVSPTDSKGNIGENTGENSFSTEPDIEFSGLDDPNLLNYVEDSVYLDLVSELDSEEYFVENVEAVYYPKEYIEELEFNSQENIYFGYTSSQLDAAFGGKKYVFTLDENGKTVPVLLESSEPEDYGKVIEDVVVGSGVILISVTVSAISAGAGTPAVGMIFACSATTATTFAQSGALISGAAATITTAYQTEDVNLALKKGIQAGAAGFKWGAITGAIVGGGAEAIALKGATLNGLTMNEAAAIQAESGFPIDLIKQFKSMEEYNVYKNAGLYTKMVNGRLALVRDIDLNYVSELKGEQVTNLVRMQKGYAPVDPATGKVYQLHHINQDADGTLAVLTEAEHQGNAFILNTQGKTGVHNPNTGDPNWAAKRQTFWKAYATLVG
ncbi:A nuclease of the HNH/ENDO VII superfamily with conserved LHH [Pseudobutyrivibrio sp. 49]|uniref:HNH/ENDO VII family nuclease n=1 Tax=Pseudobutyrivibrio sp. 49 TaxID=1855344 RepID=UPI00088778F7|nr:HNH/ENDO VII family nuclease [Pseudobutyrivibrio sp. 49]SDI77188.1 A nuclease of the HNH/ENDO VII superfamily with conserved LHH [Pseudobutyrivibrio sp. 49]